MKYFIIISFLILILSCENWLDVSPKSQVESDELFDNETGFKDALWGIYTKMTENNMYGREMTFGFVDVIAQNYTNVGNVYTEIKALNYTHTSAETIIDSIWQKTYNTIANINNLIDYLEDADQAMFQEDNYNIIFGEALSLRAYLHFDLLRLFAPSFISGANELAIPYVTQYGYSTTRQFTVNEVIGKILEDLETSEKYFEESDPIYTGRHITSNEDDGFLSDRQLRMNYYAVLALKARVYLYANDDKNALKYAEMLIQTSKFSWTSVDDMAVTIDANRDRTFTSEQIFALHVNKLENYIESYLVETKYNGYRLMVNTSRTGALFTYSTDWRILYFWSGYIAGTNGYRFNTKLTQPEAIPDSYAKRVPLMRLPEMYLIAAEASLNTNSNQSRIYLNTLRTQRGITEQIPSGTSVEDLEIEITREYQREFICEGQLFFYYKRKNMNRIMGDYGTDVDFNVDNYILPMPAEEVEFGQRQ